MFKFNSPDILASVDLPLIIIYKGKEVKAKRTKIILNKFIDSMEYELEDGSLIEGRFEWRYI